jgi:hypothetical protein
MRTVEQLAETVQQMEGKAARYDQQADDCRWKACEAYHEALTVQKVAPGVFAAMVGKSGNHCRAMRKTWARYGQGRQAGWSFWDHYTAASTGHADPGERHQSNGRAVENLSAADLTSEQKTKLVGEVLGSAEGADVMERVLDDRNAAANVSRAAQRTQDRRERDTYDRNRDRRPDFMREGHLADADRLTAHAARDVEDAIAQVQAAAAIRPLSAEEQARLTSSRARLLLQTDAYGDVVKAADKSMEDELLS